MKGSEFPASLRREYLLALGPLALCAPLPLAFTYSVFVPVLIGYESAVALLLWRGFRGAPLRVSDTLLNLAAFAYLPLLYIEPFIWRHNLVITLSHLLLFTTLAKLASLKRPYEVRAVLLLVVLLALDSISNSFHVTAVLWLAAMAWLTLRTLVRLAVLADFDEAPPASSLRRLPTHGVSALMLSMSCLGAVPLFFVLPRLRSPFVRSSLAGSDASIAAFASENVSLDAFSSAKRSEQIILRIQHARVANPEAMRLREATYNGYRRGQWSREHIPATPLAIRGERWLSLVRKPLPKDRLFSMRVDQVPLGGFLFLPYGTQLVKLERGFAGVAADGTVRFPSTSPSTVRYEVAFVPNAPLALGRQSVSAEDVPAEVAREAARVTQGLTSPREIARAIHRHLQRGFVYTLDPPPPVGDPIAHFLLRSRAGHCEYFASAMALMLRARGLPARLATGSLGGEFGFFRTEVVVRGKHLHAWVEADPDGVGFQVFDPTPVSGRPTLERATLWRAITAFGSSLAFFYDRNMLGYDALDQIALYQSVDAAVRGMRGVPTHLLDSVKRAPWRSGALLLLALTFAASFWPLFRKARAPARGHATTAYLALRRLAGSIEGQLPASAPPGEVVRRLAASFPATRDDARALVDLYHREAFGGILADEAEEKELRDRLKRLHRTVG